MNKETMEYLGQRVDQARRIEGLIKCLKKENERLEKITPNETRLLIEGRDRTPQFKMNLIQVRFGEIDIDKENYFNKISCKVRDAAIDIVKAQIEELQSELEEI